MDRWSSVFNFPEVEPPVEAEMSDCFDLALTSAGDWKGDAKYVFEIDGWSVFQDLSGGLSSWGAKSWLPFADQDEFLFAGYNDAIPYGELILIRHGEIVREFLHDASDPSDNVDFGSCDLVAPLNTWIEVASFVDEDDLAFSENGLLWIHKPKP